MSRIARALEKAQTEGGDGDAGRQLPGEHARPAFSGSDSSPDDVPWEIDKRRHAGRQTPSGGIGQPRRRAARQPSGESPGGPRGLVRAVPQPIAPPPAWTASPAGAYDTPPPDRPTLFRYWEIGKRRWRTGLLILLVVVLGVTAGTLLREPTYTATGLLEIRPESTGATLSGEAPLVPVKVGTDDLETQYGILRSDTLTERVLKQMARNGTPAIQPASPVSVRSSAIAGLFSVPAPARPSSTFPNADDIKRFRERLLVDPQRGSRLVAIAYTSHDGRLSALTVNSLLDNYLQLRMEEAQHSERWLEEQLQEAQHKLEGSERRLHEYIQAHGLQVVETGKGEAAQMANERLQTLHGLLAQAQAERFQKQSEKEEARRLTAPRDVDSPVVQSLTVRLADLRREHARLSSTFKEDYPALKAVTNQIRELEQQLSEESGFVVTRGEREYQAAVRREALLRKALDEQNRVVQALGEQAVDQAGYESLKNELVANQDQFTLLNRKVKEAGIATALRASSVGIVDRARPPADADGLPLPLTLALSTMVGLFLAIGGMSLREYFDTSMRTAADVHSLGVPALGAIPTVAGVLSPHRSWRRIDDHGVQQSALAEAFASLRNAVLLDDRAVSSSRVLLVTSAQAAEGKTTVSINLALSLARLHYRVLLVDANMRYPCVRQALSLPDGGGLVEYLTSGDDWHGLLHREVRPNLDVLAGARPQTSPADLLSLPPMATLLDQAASEYDFVVLDSPALLAHPGDVQPLAVIVDNVLFTVRQGATPRNEVMTALSQLDRVSGIVMNRFDSGEPDVAWNDDAQEPERGRN